MGVKKDMQVRTIDVVRSNVSSGRTATCAIANAALDPSNAYLFHEMRINSTNDPVQHEAAYGVSGIHVSLERKLGSKFWFTSSCKDSRIDNFWVARKADR